jgi:hypothetical protein
MSETRLAEAAQALVKAATDEVKNDNLAINKSMAESGTAIASEVKQIQERLAAVVASVDQLKHKQDTLLKIQRISTLQWAMTNTSIGSFEYHTAPNNYEAVSSSTLVLLILGTFMQGKGRFLPDGRLKMSTNNTNSYQRSKPFETEEVAAFHKALVDHIYTLTGSEPILRLSEGKMAIFAGKD